MSTDLSRYALMALDCVHCEYPNRIQHLLNSDTDVKPPRELTPAFFGCYDWHSSVHGHWLLARFTRLEPDAPCAARARAALQKSLTESNIAGEVAYLRADGREAFERPYGLAWLLQLAAELREWDHPDARQWSAVLRPLEEVAAARLNTWLPKLTRPVRSGEHSQTAFALGLILDWSRTATDFDFDLLVKFRATAFYRATEFFMNDRDAPLEYEPSGEDILSPALAEADVMRRVLSVQEFSGWLSKFLPRIPVDGRADWLIPGVVSDPSDGKLVHLYGLNMSRAWMLESIAYGLPDGDPRRAALHAAAAAHRVAGLAGSATPHYAGSHWLGTFAAYLVTRRGLS